MSPVSNMQDFAIGITGKRSNALPFDPIANRNADRPKFRLDDYERKDPAASRQADPAPRERHARAHDTSDSRQEAPRDTRTARTDAKASDESKKTDTSSTDNARTDAAGRSAETNPERRQDADPVRQNQEQGATPQDNSKKTDSRKTAEEIAGTAAAAGTETDAEVHQTKSSPVQATASVETNTTAAQQPAAAENGLANANAKAPRPGAAEKAQTEQPAGVQAANAGAPQENKAETAAGQKTPTAQAAASQDMTAKSGAADKAAAETAKAVADPKLAALQKLTQPKTTPAETPAAANASDDNTSYTLPVPWPQKPGVQNAAAASAGTTKPAADIPADAAARAAQAGAQAVAAAAAHSKSAGAQPNSAPKTDTAQTNQGTQPAATANTAANNMPKIEVELPATAKQHVPSDNAALLAGNRVPSDNGRPKQSILPSQSETIAAVTALNSRVPRSNALGAAPQSNAVTSALEKASAPGTVNAAQANAAAAVSANAAQSATTNNGAPPAPVQVPGQLTVEAAETALGGRSQGGTGQSGMSEPGTTSSGPARAGETPSTAGGSSFGDSLRTAGTERAAPAAETRQPLPGAAAEQVKVKLVKAAEGGLDKIRIQLNPSELGKVDVRLEFGSDGGVRGVVTVEKPETLQLLQRDARQLEQALQDAGFKTDGESLEFQMRGGNTNGREQNAGTGNGSMSNAGGDLTAEEEQLATATAGTEQDGVSDDGSLNMVA